MKHFLLCTLLLIFSCGVAEKSEKQAASAASEHVVTAGITRITDGSKLFSLSQQDSLLLVIQEIERATGVQVGLYTLDTLHGRKIEDVSLEKAGQLKLGRKDLNDGILITIALHDRATRMEIGEGLENIISDATAARLNRDYMIPEFRQGHYFKGVLAALIETRKLLIANKELIGK